MDAPATVPAFTGGSDDTAQAPAAYGPPSVPAAPAPAPAAAAAPAPSPAPAPAPASGVGTPAAESGAKPAEFAVLVEAAAGMSEDRARAYALAAQRELLLAALVEGIAAASRADAEAGAAKPEAA